MTNGDMIKEVFPECTVRWATTSQIGVTMNNNQCGITVFEYSWWQSECFRNIMIEQTAQWDILECATHYKRCLCSNCKTPALRKNSSAYVPSKYCPNCGCRMIAETHYKDDTEFEEMYGKVDI